MNRVREQEASERGGTRPTRSVSDVDAEAFTFRRADALLVDFLLAGSENVSHYLISYVSCPSFVAEKIEENNYKIMVSFVVLFGTGSRKNRVYVNYM